MTTVCGDTEIFLALREIAFAPPAPVVYTQFPIVASSSYAGMTGFTYPALAYMSLGLSRTTASKPPLYSRQGSLFPKLRTATI